MATADETEGKEKCKPVKHSTCAIFQQECLLCLVRAWVFASFANLELRMVWFRSRKHHKTS